MRTLDLSPYEVEVTEQEDGVIRKGTQPYPVRDALINILFNPEQRLNARKLLDRNDLARKIRDHQGDQLALEDAEYQQVLDAVNAVSGFGQHDVELVRRVLNPASGVTS